MLELFICGYIFQMINLPQLPQPPTDNLYKFMAIFGLTLLVISLILPVYINYTVAVNNAEVMARIRVIDTEMAIAGDFDIFRELSEDKILTPNEKKEFVAKQKDFIVKNGQTLDELNIVTATTPALIGIMFYSTIMGIVGSILVYKGFRLWYDKLQKYQDIIVKNQAATSIRDRSKKFPTDDTTNIDINKKAGQS